jgi:hypothetical protein
MQILKSYLNILDQLFTRELVFDESNYKICARHVRVIFDHIVFHIVMANGIYFYHSNSNETDFAVQLNPKNFNDISKLNTEASIAPYVRVVTTQRGSGNFLTVLFAEMSSLSLIMQNIVVRWFTYGPTQDRLFSHHYNDLFLQQIHLQTNSGWKNIISPNKVNAKIAQHISETGRSALQDKLPAFVDTDTHPLIMDNVNIVPLWHKTNRGYLNLATFVEMKNEPPRVPPVVLTHINIADSVYIDQIMASLRSIYFPFFFHNVFVIKSMDDVQTILNMVKFIRTLIQLAEQEISDTEAEYIKNESREFLDLALEFKEPYPYNTVFPEINYQRVGFSPAFLETHNYRQIYGLISERDIGDQKNQKLKAALSKTQLDKNLSDLTQTFTLLQQIYLLHVYMHATLPRYFMAKETLGKIVPNIPNIYRFPTGTNDTPKDTKCVIIFPAIVSCMGHYVLKSAPIIEPVEDYVKVKSQTGQLDFGEEIYDVTNKRTNYSNWLAIDFDETLSLAAYWDRDPVLLVDFYDNELFLTCFLEKNADIEKQLILSERIGFGVPSQSVSNHHSLIVYL